MLLRRLGACGATAAAAAAAAASGGSEPAQQQRASAYGTSSMQGRRPSMAPVGAIEMDSSAAASGKSKVMMDVPTGGASGNSTTCAPPYEC